jgi:hypothetical protein
MVVSPEPGHPEWSNRGRPPAARERLSRQAPRAAGERSATKTRWLTSRSALGPLPLSVSQTRLWYLSQLAPDSPACNELITIRKTGPLDVEALRRALTEVVARHEAWRTTFRAVDGVPHQFVREPAEVDLPLTDLSDLASEDAVHRATEIAAADTLRPYDLADGPLIRPRLIRITEDDHRLYLGLHHLVFDGTTLHRVVFPELTALYRSYAMGLPSSLPDPQAQYTDYTMWELDWVRGPEIAGRIANWRRWLAGITPTQLPLDQPQPPCQTFAGGTIPLAIEHATVEGLRRAARTAGGTLFHALAAAYAWWMQRNSLGFPAFRHARRLYGAVVDGGAIVAPGLSLDRRTQVRRLLSSECSILAFAPMSVSNDQNARTGGDK